jgi:positive regulator of sigma E activity
LAAGGLCMVLVGAITFHISRKEYANIVLNLMLLALAFLIASERFV